MKFSTWAMKVRSRPWATYAVALHRLQRMTVRGPRRLHHAIANAEHAAFTRAVVAGSIN
jgi:hypothetical protein